MGSFISSTVTTGQDILATHLTNLRKDVALFGGDYVTATGSANAYVVSLDAQIVAYVTGMTIKFKANFSNTGTATVNVNTLGAKTLVKNVSVSLNINDILNGQIITAIYDGTNFQIISSTTAVSQMITYFTAGENLNGTTTPVPVYISDGTGGRTSGRVYQSDANDSTNEARFCYGFIKDNVSSGNEIGVYRGEVSGFSGLTIGSYYYVSDTVGTISATVGTSEVPAGLAVSATKIDVLQKIGGTNFISSDGSLSNPSTGVYTSPVPAIARMAIINASTATITGGKYGTGQVTLMRYGATTGSIEEIGNINHNALLACSWSGSTITLTSTLDGSVTAVGAGATIHYYR